MQQMGQWVQHLPSGNFGLLEKRLVGRKKVNLPPVGYTYLLEVCVSPAVIFFIQYFSGTTYLPL